jgi:hypothetical protein
LHGAELSDEHGNRLVPVALVLETYCRKPEGKHRCLELLAQHGITLPDTPTMALHRSRIDLLETHLRRDLTLLSRTFEHEEIYPPELGCSADHSLALHGTPIAGAAWGERFHDRSFVSKAVMKLIKDRGGRA